MIAYLPSLVTSTIGSTEIAYTNSYIQTSCDLFPALFSDCCLHDLFVVICDYCIRVVDSLILTRITVLVMQPVKLTLRNLTISHVCVEETPLPNIKYLVIIP